MDDFSHLDDDYEFCTGAIKFNSQYNVTLDDGSTLCILSKNYHESHWYSIHQFVKAIENASDLKIKSIINSNFTDLPNNEITAFYEQVVGLSRSHDPDITYGPHVQTFYDIAEDIQLDSEVDIEKFKTLVKKIRLITKKEFFRKKVKQRNERLRNNEKKAFNYIDTIFQHHSRLLFLRLDFHLKMPERNWLYQHRRIRKYFSSFLNDRRSNKFFNHELGYLWKFEHGESMGGHYHLMIILDGAYVQKDEFIAWQIGEFWKKITKGKGTYFNANSKKYLKNNFSSIGIGVGRIESHDIEKRANLTRVVKYFFKAAQYVEAKLSRGMRSFATGKFKVRSGRGGRPRKVRQQ